ncbi:diaminobutyrate-2-oxoglutarate transaminase [Pedobacter terrae]|uniref:Diaminobutyrate-2-oxoglutarate transaminase n=1 Tax=Pedobacter terrae TaxID=405671 RepID=A0A1G8EP40_9SPHI|nr:aspartate aminotransferase family protein [Pedobacter terrae]SDH71632.1 diaminobutyrate-2-oxoglutarate transaminase [Pedobacter terrae]
MQDFSKYHLSNKQLIITPELPGQYSKELLLKQSEIEGKVVSYPKSMPIAIKRAKGAIIEDVDGNHFIDFFAGAGVVNVGHCNPDILIAVKEQQEQLIHALDFPTENKIEAINLILTNLPVDMHGQYKVSFGGPTGSDAVEAAIKLAKMQTKRDTIIAFTGGYHGMTSGALALTSNTGFREKLTSLIPNVHFVPYSYCYRCAFRQSPGSCRHDCVSYLEDILENPHSGVPKPAAILLEPLQGEGGNIVPDNNYLEKLVSLAHKHGIIVIFDEIQSGFYRTGEFFAFMHTKARPDIITFSKGFGGVGFPISGLIYRKDLEAWGPGAHIGTFRANQVSLAACRAAIKFVNRTDLALHVGIMGCYLMTKLNELFRWCPFIGEIRGQGLMIGIEFVKDISTKSPYPEIVKVFRERCFQSGLLFEVGGHFNNVVRLVPPLIITTAIADAAISIMSTELRAAVIKMQSVNNLVE